MADRKTFGNTQDFWQYARLLAVRKTFWQTARLLAVHKTSWQSARLLAVPGTVLIFETFCGNVALLRQAFLKTLDEKANKKTLSETLKTSNLPNQIIFRPPKSRETIPLTNLFLYTIVLFVGLKTNLKLV